MQKKRMAAFAAIYLFWGSSYLAMRAVVHVVPPMLAASVRYGVSGMALLAFSFTILREALPTGRQALNSVVTGISMIVLGYAVVFWAVTLLPSWVVAVLVSTSFLWTYLGECFILRTAQPRTGIIFLLMLGLAGIPLLSNAAVSFNWSISSAAVAGVLASTFVWSATVLAMKKMQLPKSHWQTAGLQLGAAGTVLAAISGVFGEWGRIPSMHLLLGFRPLLGMAYLVVCGSILAYSSFHWLMRRESPSLVATFAYVNPVVAMLLGIGIAHEPCSLSQLLGAIAILLSVILLWRGKALHSPTRMEFQEQRAARHSA